MARAFDRPVGDAVAELGGSGDLFLISRIGEIYSGWCLRR
jgi:hypothetical protein